MATVPARTVGLLKRAFLRWSVKWIWGLLIPLAFTASCFGVAIFAGSSLVEAGIAAAIGGLVVLIEGVGYRERIIRPMFFDAEIQLGWFSLRRPFLMFTGLLALAPLAGLIACLASLCFNDLSARLAAAVAACLTLAVVLIVLNEMTAEFVWKFQRGQLILTEAEVAKKIRRLTNGRVTPESSYRFWGGQWMSDTIIGPHTQVVGKTRSGKTVTMTLWLQSFVPCLYPGSHWRAVVFDAKAELWPAILGMNPPCPVISLCPIHAEGYAWNIAADINTPAQAKTFAAMLIPDEGETQKYFPRSARRILEAVIRWLIRISPGRWDLLDILHILNDVPLLRAVLESDPSTRYLIEKYFEPESTWKNTLSTLDVTISRYETVAACWRHAASEGRIISLADFLATSSILVISRIQDLRDALDPINRLILQRLFELLLAGPEIKLLPEDSQPRTYLLLDEIAKAGKIDLLDDIMLQGAGKGVRVFLAYQSILSMRAEYGDKQADALVGQCSNTAVYQVDRETAEWAARQFGEYEAIEDLQMSSGNTFPRDHKTHLQRTKLQTLLSSQFTTLAYPHETHRISGYYLTDGIGAYEVSFPFIDMLPQPANIPTIPRRPASQQELPDTFSAEDVQRLGLDRLQTLNNQATRPTPGLTPSPQSPPCDPNKPDSLRFIRNLRGRHRSCGP